MKKPFFTFLSLIIIATSATFGQTQVSSKQFEEYKNFPQEKIYVHYNSDFIVTGEQLLFKIYSLNKNNNTLSNLSKIAYVQLLNNKKEVVFEKKIKLNNGLGQGDFFITSNIKSGEYKLVSFTNLMKNNNNYFRENVTIINPFSNRILVDKNATKYNNKTVESTNIILNKNDFNKRSLVNITLNNLNNLQNVSLSVRKKTESIYPKKNSNNFTNNKGKSQTKNRVFLPDLRGDLLKGKITTNNKNLSLDNVSIGLSIIQKNGISKISKTNNKGEFYFNLKEDYIADKAYIKVLNNNKGYKLSVIKNNNPDYSNLQFNKVIITKEQEKTIKERSIYSQIENAYNSQKKDSILNSYNIPSILKNRKIITFKLDDYKRFKTMKETMVEVITHAWINKEKDGDVFYVRGNGIDLTPIKPIVIVDNYIVSNHQEIIDFDTKEINAIYLVRDILKINGEIYRGIIFIDTFKGDYKPIFSFNNMLSINLNKPQPTKKYYSPDYSKQNNKRIPDFRTQLLWLPNIDATKENISFYTSDVTGDFEIEIEGFTQKGKPISMKKTFTVK